MDTLYAYVQAVIFRFYVSSAGALCQDGEAHDLGGSLVL